MVLGGLTGLAGDEASPSIPAYFNPLTLALFCFVPLIVFMPPAILMTDSRRVRCSHCRYNHDFPARKRG